MSDGQIGVLQGLISADGWSALGAGHGSHRVGWTTQPKDHPQGGSRNGLLRLIPPTGGAGYVLKIFRKDTPDRAGEQIAGHWAGL